MADHTCWIVFAEPSSLVHSGDDEYTDAPGFHPSTFFITSASTFSHCVREWWNLLGSEVARRVSTCGRIHHATRPTLSPY